MRDGPPLMAPTVGSGRQKRVRDEAAAWHARMMEPTSKAEVVAFEHWLQADPAHARAYDEVQSISSLGTRLPSRLLARSRSEEHTSELQSLMRNSYAVFCLKK